ncbi:MAG: hypothetical protein ACUVTB_06140 [Candidatus Bathycorpusculaceae bacterium]
MVLYVILAIFSLVSTLVMLKISEPRRVKRKGVSMRNLLPKKSKYVLASGMIAIGADMVIPLMTAWLGLQYGISDAISGPILGISSMVAGIATLAAPVLAKRIGLAKAITVKQTVSTVFMFAVPLSSNYVSAGFTYALRSFLTNMANPWSNQ